MTASEQARADAIADAETLCACGHEFRSHVRGYYVGPCRGRAINAPACKRIPAPCLCDAFRAVPGLRGEMLSPKVHKAADGSDVFER